MNQEQAGEFNFAHSLVFFPGPPVPGGVESKGAGVAITSDTFGTPRLPPRPPFTPPPTDRWEFVMNPMYKCRGLCLASTSIRNPLPESASASSTDTLGCMTISPSLPSVACPLPSKERSSRPFSCQGYHVGELSLSSGPECLSLHDRILSQKGKSGKMDSFAGGNSSLHMNAGNSWPCSVKHAIYD